MKNDFFDKIAKGGNSRDNIYDDNYGGKDYDTEEYYDETEETYEEYDDNDVEYVEDDDFEEYEEDVPSKPKKKGAKTLRGKIVKWLLTIIVAAIALSGIVSLFLPTKTNVLIMATDEDGTRTDTIMVASFDKKTKDITLLSVPRDTYVTVSDDAYEKMNKDYPQPGSTSMKINAIHHYGGEKYGVKLLVNQVEEIIGTDIDFYLKVNFDAFKYIIDAVGGINFYVPRDMEYHDPVQNLHISLKEGMQHLNGDQAEQVVRYRSGYANADLGRVSVQQDFMKEFITQVVTVKNLITKPGVFINVLFNGKYVDTNANLFNVLPYAFVIGGIDVDNIESATLPGRAGFAQGQSVYFIDEAACAELTERFYK